MECIFWHTLEEATPSQTYWPAPNDDEIRSAGGGVDFLDSSYKEEKTIHETSDWDLVENVIFCYN